MHFQLKFCPIITLLILFSINTFSQSTGIGNVYTPGNYLGWGASVSSPLNIKHENSNSIIFKLNNQPKMGISSDGNLGIPTTSNGNSRFSIFNNTTAISIRKTYHSNIYDNAGSTYDVSGSIYENIAIHGESMGGSTLNIGVTGVATGATYNYGIFATECGNGSSIAGYFDGDLHVVNGWTASDESLKENVEELTGVLENLMSIEPMSYNFIEMEALNLPSGLQYGVLAQELMLVFPNCVKSFEVPIFETNDEDENVISDQYIQLNAVNYQLIIPLLVAGYKEQDEIILSQKAEIDDLITKLIALEQKSTFISENAEPLNEKIDDDFDISQNYPNPFTTQTTINYTLHTSSNVKIYIQNNNNVKILEIVNDFKENGTYSYEWNPPKTLQGIYYCVIEVNGVKQSIKLLKL